MLQCLEKEKLKTKMEHNIFSNNIEITCSIHKGLYFLVCTSFYKSSSASRIFMIYLKLINTRLSYWNYSYSDGIWSSLFVLLSIASFFLTLRLFVSRFTTIISQSFFSIAVPIARASWKSFLFSKTIKNRGLGSRASWQGRLELTTKVW